MDLFARSVKMHVDMARKWYPGDILSGVVTLNVRKPVEAQELVITLTGTEHLKWDEIRGAHRFATGQTHEHFSVDVHCELLDALTPGESLHPFSFELPKDLPATFAYSSVVLGSMDSVRVNMDYEMTVKLVRKGLLHANLVETLPLIIKPNPQAVIPKPQVASASQLVRAFGLFKQGQCHVRMELRSDVVVFPSDVVLTAIIDNESKTSVSGIRCVLYEDMEVIQSRVGEHPIEKQTNIVVKHLFEKKIVDEIVNGKPIRLTFPIPGIKRLLPSMSSYFVHSLGFRISVEVSLSMSRRVKVSVPVRLVQKDRARPY